MCTFLDGGTTFVAARRGSIQILFAIPPGPRSAGGLAPHSSAPSPEELGRFFPLTVSAVTAVVTVPLATPVAKRCKNHRRFDPAISTLLITCLYQSTVRCCNNLLYGRAPIIIYNDCAEVIAGSV